MEKRIGLFTALKKGFKPPRPSSEEEERQRRRFLGRSRGQKHDGDAGDDEPDPYWSRTEVPGSKDPQPSFSDEDESHQTDISFFSKRRASRGTVTQPPTYGSIEDKELDGAIERQNFWDPYIPSDPHGLPVSNTGRPRMEMPSEGRETEAGNIRMIPKIGQANADMLKSLPETPTSGLGVTVQTPSSSQSMSPWEHNNAGPFGRHSMGQPRDQLGSTDFEKLEAREVPTLALVQAELEIPAAIPDRILTRDVLRRPVPQGGTIDYSEIDMVPEASMIKTSLTRGFEPTSSTRNTLGNETNPSDEVSKELNEGLDLIYRYLYGVKIKHPEILFQKDIFKPFSFVQIEMAMQDLVEAYATTSLACLDLNDKIENQGKEIKALENENKRLLGVLDGTISAHQRQEEKADGRIRKFQSEHRNTLKSLANGHALQIKALIEERELRVQQLNSTCSSLKADHANIVSNLRREHEHQLIESTKTARKRIEEMKQKSKVEFFAERDAHSRTESTGKTIDTLTEEYERKLSKMSTQYETEKKKMQQDLQYGRKEIEATLSMKEIEYEEALKIAAEGYRTALADLQTQHAQDLDAKSKEASEIRKIHASEMSSVKEHFKEQMKAMKVKLDQATTGQTEDMTAMAIAHELALQAAEEKSQEQLDRLNYQLKQTIEGKEQEILHIRKKFDSETKNASRIHQQKVESLVAHYQQQIVERDFEIKRERSTFEDEIAELKETQTLAKLARNRALTLSNETLMEALVKKDHFKILTDDEVARRFHCVTSEVDQLARVPWDRSKEASWPFPSSSFPTSENRRAKKNVLGNIMWVVLYETIICTPFRMLGNEGRSLEQQWVQQFGQDQKYSGTLAPPATEESEIWRYETMAKLFEDIKQPLSDANYAIKNDFETNLQESANQLVRELESVTSVSKRDKQRIGALAKAMAELWLEVGQQRYRMFFLMSETDKVPLQSGKSALSCERSLSLVIMPELRRLGNGQGDALDVEETVMDCHGKFSVFAAD